MEGNATTDEEEETVEKSATDEPKGAAPAPKEKKYYAYFAMPSQQVGDYPSGQWTRFGSSENDGQFKFFKEHVENHR